MQATESIDGRARRLTTANVNAWFADVLADPARRATLKQDWVQLLLSDIPVTPAERASLTSLPAEDARALQSAIAQVVDHGGRIYLERPSETEPGRLIVRPSGGTASGVPGSISADFSFGIFHCTFDAYFQHWHCGWGPG